MKPITSTDAYRAAHAIAARFLYLKTLETRKNDTLDFHTLAVWDIRAALFAAYEAGVAGATRSHVEEKHGGERPSVSAGELPYAMGAAGRYLEVYARLVQDDASAALADQIAQLDAVGDGSEGSMLGEEHVVACAALAVARAGLAAINITNDRKEGDAQ